MILVCLLNSHHSKLGHRLTNGRQYCIEFCYIDQNIKTINIIMSVISFIMLSSEKLSISIKINLDFGYIKNTICLKIII